MPVKVNVGLAKKIGQPDYGSLGATCNVEFDLDGGFDNGSTQHFQDAVRRAYTACRQAVEAEIEINRIGGQNSIGGQHSSPSVNHVAPGAGIGVGSNGHGLGNGNGNSNRNGGGNSRAATSSQVRAIHAIANRSRVDLPGLLNSRFAVNRPEDLSITDASSLIDQMKGTSGNSGTPVSQ